MASQSHGSGMKCSVVSQKYIYNAPMLSVAEKQKLDSCSLRYGPLEIENMGEFTPAERWNV